MSHVLKIADSILLSTMNNALSMKNVDFKNSSFFLLTGTSDSLTSGSTVVETNVDALNPDIETELQILLQTSKSRSQTL